MTLNQHPFTGPADLPAMAALVADHPAHNLHVVDLPYRLCSWALDEPDNVGLWFNEHGRLRAWAVMQTPFWCIDLVLHPADEAEYPQLLAWADQRASVLLGGAYARPLWFVYVPGGPGRPGFRASLLESAGFASQKAVAKDPYSMVLMQLSGQVVPPSGPPSGFTIRPLAGLPEVPAYVACHQAVFQSDSMRIAWRVRTLAHPTYQPDLDLVAVDAAGRLAGFCIGWLSRHGGQIEPLGVHPDYRGRGLGRALLAEGLRRLQARGAERIVVATDDFRDAAFGLYQSAGFRVTEPVEVYRKDYL